MSNSEQTEMNDLRVTLIQSPLVWHDAAANREAFGKAMAELAGKTDLVVLPEMFTTSFTIKAAEVAEDWQQGDNATVNWMREQAAKSGAAITGSLAIKDGERYVNRMPFVTPEGDVQYYDKRHLFRMANEHNHYSDGKERKVVEFRGWRILLQVCYDLRFPVFARNRSDYDLALYVANWPKVRRDAWRALLKARAIENQAYVMGSNRSGADGNGIQYSGDSMVLDFKGKELVDHPVGAEFVETIVLSMQAKNAFLEKFPAWRDMDAFELVDA